MSKAPKISVVVVPFPAQGHLNQLLHFSLHLSARGLPVHFASTPTHNSQAKHRLHGWDPSTVESVAFHDLHIPPFSSPPPNPNSTIKFPAHLQPMFDASDHLRAPLSDLLRSLSSACDRLVIVHDPLMAFSGIDAMLLPNVEVYRFQCLPAFFLLSFFNSKYFKQLPEDQMAEGIILMLKLLDGLLTKEFAEFVGRRWVENPLECGTILNSCQAIEHEFIDLLAKQPIYEGKKIFAVGPINPISVKKSGLARHECLEWLDKQPVASVVYISFGTTCTISDEQIRQLAFGIQRSEQRYIWVLREADLGDVFGDGREGNLERRKIMVPESFVEETKERGLVVREWAPQLEILAHRSTGGFMSHCGWNSCMESLGLGVPMIAWPMHSDQPRNAILVTEYLKAGVKVREWEGNGRVVEVAEIEEAIRGVMVGGEEGMEIRRRAKLIGEAMRTAVCDGESSRGNLDSFVDHITRS